MDRKNISLTPQEIHTLLKGDDESLRAYFQSLPHAADITEFLEKIDLNSWPRLLYLIDDTEKRAEVVSKIDETSWSQLLAKLAPDEIAALLKQMESDDATDIVSILPLQVRVEALKRLPTKERLNLQQLLKYPDDSAGGIMQIERAQVREDAQVSDAINRVRDLVEEDVEVLAVWVVDKENRLVGSVALADLLLNKATTAIKKLIKKDPISVQLLMDQEQVAAIFKKYDLMTVPVVDDENHLLGRIMVDDVVHVLAEEADEDTLRMAGTTEEELLHQEEVLSTARIRFPWLAIALFYSLISAVLLHSFESIVQKAVIIMTFIPVITAMGGNVGITSSTLLIRGFATGKVDLSKIPRILFKEVRVGLLMGLSCGLVAGAIGTYFLGDGNWYLGLVVLLSMTITMVAASSVGVFAPVILKKFNIDPAIASGPFVATLNDITGILIYMTIATLFLTRL
ncbi:magnesium transporter [Sulfobacillus acidophilus]|uniref:Magnesium transporter MgtE n=1 Tax=Sulfobacillus acidophilus TaxID=53633 RepID=A0ABS3AWJ4_9FIRM|nr:magnesium transporter [Sulfobacillus acidophilus]